MLGNEIKLSTKCKVVRELSFSLLNLIQKYNKTTFLKIEFKTYKDKYFEKVEYILT